MSCFTKGSTANTQKQKQAYMIRPAMELDQQLLPWEVVSQLTLSN